MGIAQQTKVKDQGPMAILSTDAAGLLLTGATKPSMQKFANTMQHKTSMCIEEIACPWYRNQEPQRYLLVIWTDQEPLWYLVAKEPVAHRSNQCNQIQLVILEITSGPQRYLVHRRRVWHLLAIQRHLQPEAGLVIRRVRVLAEAGENGSCARVVYRYVTLPEFD